MNRNTTEKRRMSIFLVVIMLGLYTAAHADDWRQCAEEGDICHLNPGSWAVRYGASDKDGDSFYYYTEYDNANPIQIKCDNNTFGDPLRGSKDKVCQYRRVYDSPDDDFLGCSSEGTRKQCGYQTDPSVQWTQCAKEGDDCQVNTNGLVAIRYGSYEAGKWWQRNWSSTGGKVECSNHAWQTDPAKGYKKVCEWAELPEYAMRAVGFEWRQIVGPCDNCTDPTITTSVGVSVTEGTSNTSSFSASVGAQVSAQVNVGLGVDVLSVSETLGVQYSETFGAEWSKTVSNQVTQSRTITEQFTCSFDTVPDDTNVLVYQFVTSSYRIGAGNVDVGNVQDSSFVCILTPKGQPPLVPACLPNYFDSKDPFGQTCLADGRLPTS